MQEKSWNGGENFVTTASSILGDWLRQESELLTRLYQLMHRRLFLSRVTPRGRRLPGRPVRLHDRLNGRRPQTAPYVSSC